MRLRAHPQRKRVKLGIVGQSSPVQADFTGFNTTISPRKLDYLLVMQDMDTEPLYYGAYLTWATAQQANLMPTISPSVHTLNAFVAGTFDSSGLYSGGLAGMAADAVAYGGPIIVRLAHEFNGNFGTAYGYTKETAAQFVAGWQKIVNVFRANGATNVLWCWAPNVWTNSAGAILDPTVNDGSGSSWYPGDSYVDIIGLDGYESVGNPTVLSPALLYLSEYATLTAAYPTKPFAITEFGCTTEARLTTYGGKEGWYDLFFAMVKNQMPKCIFVNQWERVVGGDDYTISSSGANLTARTHFVTGVNSLVFV